MAFFDFNVNNYQIEDLMEIFKLDAGNQIRIVDIERQEEWLKQRIDKDHTMDKEKKRKLQNFITNAKDQLLKSTTSQFVPTFPSDIYTGNLNPLTRRTIKKVLNIDTRFLFNMASATNFRVDLPMQFNNVVNMSLKTFEFPDNYYNISADLGNNTFTITNHNGSVNNVVIQDGTYTTTSLIDYLTSTVPGFTFQDNNNKMVISSTSTFSMTFASTPKVLYQTFGWLIGFRQCNYTGLVQYTSEAMIDLNTLKYCYLCIDDFNNNVNNSFVSAFQQSVLNSNILGRISFPASSPPLIVENTREYFGPVNIQAIQVQLLDAFGNVMDLNQLNYSFCLEFEIIYNI